jgi:hypothetical protein
MKLKSAAALLGAVPDIFSGADVEYTPITKSNDKRFTFGPMYIPGAIDAHGEYAEADPLQEALWDFAQNGDRTLRKQHGPQAIGKIVEFVAWPFEQTLELTNPGTGLSKSLTLPAGTVYTGALWEPEVWPLVKSGRFTGYSMGGTAVRMRDQSAEGLLKLR